MDLESIYFWIWISFLAPWHFFFFFFPKIAAKGKKINGSTGEIQPENRDADLGSKCFLNILTPQSLTTQYRAEGSTDPQGLSGRARGQDAWVRPLWLWGVLWAHQRPSSLRLLFHITSGESLVWRWRSNRGGCYRCVVPGVSGLA